MGMFGKKKKQPAAASGPAHGLRLRQHQHRTPFVSHAAAAAASPSQPRVAAPSSTPTAATSAAAAPPRRSKGDAGTSPGCCGSRPPKRAAAAPLASAPPASAPPSVTVSVRRGSKAAVHIRVRLDELRLAELQRSLASALCMDEGALEPLQCLSDEQWLTVLPGQDQLLREVAAENGGGTLDLQVPATTGMARQPAYEPEPEVRAGSPASAIRQAHPSKRGYRAEPELEPELEPREESDFASSHAASEERFAAMEFDAFRQAAGSMLQSERELRQAAEERAASAAESAVAAVAAAEGVHRARRSPRALNFSQQLASPAAAASTRVPVVVARVPATEPPAPEVSPSSVISWSPRSIHSSTHNTAAAPRKGSSVPAVAETAAARAVREMSKKLAQVEAELQAARSQRPQRHSPSPSPARVRLSPAQAAPAPALSQPAASSRAVPDYAQAARLNELSMKAAQVQDELRRAREARGGNSHASPGPMSVPLVASPERQQQWHPQQWQQQDTDAQVDDLHREFAQLGSSFKEPQRSRSPRRGSSPPKTSRKYSPDQPRGAAFGVMRGGRFDNIAIREQRAIRGGRPTYHKTMQ